MVGRPHRKVAPYLGTSPTQDDVATAKAGRPVLRVDVLPAAAGDALELRFVSASSPRPQGVWVAVDGLLEVAGQQSAQCTLWMDTAPAAVGLRVLSADPPVLWIYNIWKQGPRGDMGSLNHASGMLRDVEGAENTYRCHDLGPEARFDAVVFKIRRLPP